MPVWLLEKEWVSRRYAISRWLRYFVMEHIDSCLVRYRSSKSEESAYLPYGGGPCVRCEWFVRQRVDRGWGVAGSSPKVADHYAG